MARVRRNNSVSALQEKISYQFRDAILLETALTHSSTGKANNERLEYLGDAMLGFIIAEALFLKFPQLSEGHLTRLRASLVRRETLAQLAREIDLGDFLRLGAGELKNEGWRRDSTLANALEALIGALYLDSDVGTCRAFVVNLYADLFENIAPDMPAKDPKTALQELLQAKKMALPSYEIIKEEGAAHLKTFTVACRVAGLQEPVIAAGSSKRNAEQAAAEDVLARLDAADGEG